MSDKQHHHDRRGARQPERFDPARAAGLDDPSRFDYLPPDQVVVLLDAPQGACVIDFGTGTGTYAIELARQRPDLSVVALDEQSEMLDLLRAKPALATLPNIKPVLTDALPGLEGKADRILAINVLHEVGDEPLSGLVKLLKPKGEVLFIDWNAEVERPVGPPRDHVYSAAQARKRIEGFGLAVTHERFFRYQYALTARRR